MTFTASDIIILPYDTQFSYAGVQYARNSLGRSYNRTAIDNPDDLRRLVTGVAFEMATRRWLEAQPVRYNRLNALTFTDPHRFDLAIGGRRCNLKSALISSKKDITQLHANPGWLLDALAAIPPEEVESDQMGEQDIYIFGFVTALEARHSVDTQKAVAKDLPVYLINLPPSGSWGGGGQWRSLGGLVLKSSASEAVSIEIGGLGGHREPLNDRIKLPSLTRISAHSDYFAVTYLRAATPPNGTIGLHSPVLNVTHLIEPTDWANIWVYGMRVYLCGWINKHDFRTESQRLLLQDTVKPHYLAGNRSRAMPVSALRPMAELAAIAQKHERV
jgi:hypothetical protein